MALKTDQVIQNRYRIIAILGEGGMATVYQALDLRLDVHVALKEMLPQPGLDAHTLSQLRQQFQREAQILARLDHPNLVRVSDFFSWRGAEYLVMNFVTGESLADVIKREGPLPESQVLTWAGQLLDALAYCHARGIVHRDIKPQNVIIRPTGQAVLVDFGLVKLWDPNDPHTKTTMRGMGTPEYAPPEQYDVDMGHTDARSDIYALGATLYHALVGQAPITATMRIADPEQFQPMVDSLEHISESTKSAVLKALALARSQRWQSAAEMAAALGVKISSWSTYQEAAATSAGEAASVAAAQRGGTRKMDEAALPRPTPLPDESEVVEKPPLDTAKPKGRRRGFALLYVLLLLAGISVGGLVFFRDDIMQYLPAFLPTGSVTTTPPMSVVIDGPTSGRVGAEYTLRAQVLPDATTQPVTYTWEASGQSRVIHTNYLSDTVTFTWNEVGTQVVTVTVANAAGSPTTNTHVITITSSGAPSVSPSTLFFIAAMNGKAPAPRNISINYSEGDEIEWSASKTASWLSVYPISGSTSISTPAMLTASVTISGLVTGVYTDVVEVQGAFMPQYVQVTLKVHSGKIYLPLVLLRWPPITKNSGFKPYR